MVNDIEKLGSILRKQKLITEEQFSIIKKEKQSIDRKKRHGVKDISDIAVKVIEGLKLSLGNKKTLGEETIMRALAKEFGIKFKRLDPLDLDAETVTGTIPKPFALKHKLVPIYKSNGKIVVAVINPGEREAIAQIKMVSEMDVETVISTYSDIENIINRFFTFSDTIKQAKETVTGSSANIGNLEQLSQMKSEDEISSSDQHIQNAVDTIIREALTLRSSDIHIEPKREETVIRNRIDGALIDTNRIPSSVHSALVSRIKLLARMDISEKRKPQDGRIKIQDDGKEIELRVSVLPVAFGEKVVIRIFDYEMAYRGLETLGFFPDELTKYKTILKKPHGIVLVTGPTGSGKTSTLYSSLKEIYNPEQNIVTIEDPIEMVVPEFNQVGVQQSIGFGFANALRAILRQDPDIIMIGEIRDRETAENAIQSALTGHFVISTLHTNDTASSLTRLYDLGIDPYLMKTSLNGILAQRLIRVICDKCKSPHIYDEKSLKSFDASNSGETLYKGKGCGKCRMTGYYGRQGVHELLVINESVRVLIDGKTPEDKIKKLAMKEGMRSLQQNAMQVFKNGETTLEEVIKISHTPT